MTLAKDSRRKSPLALAKAESKLRDFAIGYPETVEEFPWGHRAMKVRGKVFVFLALDGDMFSMSVKLPGSNMAALMLPFAAPTGYGLGKSGWVSAQFDKGDEVPVELLQSWIDESFRAIAPKRLVRQMDETPNLKARATVRRAAPKK